MRQTGLRSYEVKPNDFPLAISIRAKSLKESVVIVTAVHVIKSGQEQPQIPVTTTKPDKLTTAYQIGQPNPTPPCDLVQTILGWFGKKPANSARYEITIAGSAGDQFNTSIGVPSIDPGIANLTFQYR